MEPLPDEEVAKLDPGIRKVVMWMRGHGFETTDSGDGITKLDAGDFEALDEPHVFVKVEFDEMVAESKRLLGLLRELGLEVGPGDVQASYDPVDESSVLMLVGIDDEEMFGAKGKAN